MSAVARAIQVSVVYYRDVERGTRRPFSRVRIDLRGMNADMQNLAVLFANCVSRRRLAKATIEQLRQAMTRAG
jgi:hypothetical protein